MNLREPRVKLTFEVFSQEGEALARGLLAFQAFFDGHCSCPPEEVCHVFVEEASSRLYDVIVERPRRGRTVPNSHWFPIPGDPRWRYVASFRNTTPEHMAWEILQILEMPLYE